MKRQRPLFIPAIVCLVLWQAASAFAAIEATVNGIGNTDAADSDLTLTEAILWMNSPGYRVLTAAESNQVATVGGSINRIRFGISGAGPHTILAPDTTESGALFPPITASDLVVDGYSQPGAQANSNAILAPNNAALKIVIDSRTATNPDGEPTLGIIGSRVFVRGLSLLGGAHAIGFGSPDINVFPNRGGGVQGCWIGLSPDQATLAGPGIGSYAYQSGGSQVYGTDGDGVNDRNEFNVWVGCQEMAIGLENDFPGDGYTTNIVIAGNFIGVMPNGLSAISSYEGVTEGDAIEIAHAHHTRVGTDSDGVADEDERNIIGGLQTETGGNSEAIQVWWQTENIQVMGNYFGVGIDGTTSLPNRRFIQIDDSAPSTTIFVGGNGDGVRDALEANIVANSEGSVFRFAGPSNTILFGHNSFFGNTTDNFFSDNGNSYNAVVLGLATPTVAEISPAISNSTTRAELIGWVPVSGDPSANSRSNAVIHIYEADGTSPQGKKWMASYADNGPQDLDAATNYFRFNICSLPIASVGANLTVAQTCGDDLGGGTSWFATPLALPDVSNALAISAGGGLITVSWQMNGVLQTNVSLTSGTWGNVPGCSPVKLPASSGSLYFRVAQ